MMGSPFMALEERAGLIREIDAITQRVKDEGRDYLTPDELNDIHRKMDRVRELNRP